GALCACSLLTRRPSVFRPLTKVFPRLALFNGDAAAGRPLFGLLATAERAFRDAEDEERGDRDAEREHGAVAKGGADEARAGAADGQPVDADGEHEHGVAADHRDGAVAQRA